MISLRSSFLLLTVLFVLLGLSQSKSTSVSINNSTATLQYSPSDNTYITNFFLPPQVNSEIFFQVLVNAAETTYPINTLTLLLFPGYNSTGGDAPFSVTFNYTNGTNSIEADLFSRWYTAASSQNNQTQSTYLPLNRTIYVWATSDLHENATFTFELQIFANTTCKLNEYGPQCKSPVLPPVQIPMVEAHVGLANVQISGTTFLLLAFEAGSNSNSSKSYGNVNITFSFTLTGGTSNEFPSIYINDGFYNLGQAINDNYTSNATFFYTLPLPIYDPIGYFLIFVPPESSSSSSQFTLRDNSPTYTVTLNFLPLICNETTVGEHCQYQLVDISNQAANPGFLFFVNTTTFFFSYATNITVAAASENTKNQGPEFQVSLFPDVDSGVTGEGYFVKFAQLDSAVSGLPSRFYVKVTIPGVNDDDDDDSLSASDDDDNNAVYVWFNSACPSNCTDEESGKASSCALCSGNGACTTTSYTNGNGTCTCKSNWKGFNCGTAKFKLVYIILIAIGGAIVLALAIGIPVGCFFKNRKRARYERV